MTGLGTPLAAFVSPGLFALGAAAISVPVVIHILARRRFRRIRWAATEFLLDAHRRNRRRIRIEEWLLMALRCLAVLLIGTLVARPFLRPEGASGAWGGVQRAERVFVLDDSLSMTYHRGEERAFDAARRTIRRLIAAVREEHPDDTVTLLRMTDPTHPVESGTYLNDVQTEQLQMRLEALQPTQRAIDPATVVAGTAEVLGRGEVVNAVVYFVSDFAYHDWVRGAAPSGGDTQHRPGTEAPNETVPPDTGAPSMDPSMESAAGAQANVLAPLLAWAGEDRGLRLVMVHVGDSEAANLSVGGLRVGDTAIIAGSEGTVTALVTNHSAAEAEQLSVEVGVGPTSAALRTVRSIAPGQSVPVEFRVPFPRAGDETIRVSVPADRLAGDDTRYAVVGVNNALRVLVVDGEPTPDAYDDEAALLVTALRPEGEVFSGIEPVVVEEAALDSASLAEFQAVVLANVYRLSEPFVEELERFVRHGGGLIVFCGDQVDLDWYNTSLVRDGDGLLAARLEEAMRPAAPVHLETTDRFHPVMRTIDIEGDPLGLRRVGFRQYVRRATEDGPGAEGGADRESATRTSTADVHVLARFEGGAAALIEREFGDGRVVLCTSSADKEWNDWPDHPTYVPMMIEMVRHVARRGSTGSEVLVGEPIELVVDPAVFAADAVVRTPAYPTELETGVTALPARSGRGVAFRWEHTDSAGVYELILTRREGGTLRRLVAVNVDPRESDLTTTTEEELRTALGGVPFEFLRDVERAPVTAETRTELWPVLLLAALFVLMTEHGLAWWFGRRS
jgi:hypothetical protein